MTIDQEVTDSAALVKLVCGVGNNAAWQVMLTGYDHARRCRYYSYKVKQAFHLAIKSWHDYERALIHAQRNRMFNMDDMPDHIRQRYGDISNRQYYEFWASIGGPAYHKTLPQLSTLQHKYALSLQAHGVTDAEHVAWVITAHVALELSLVLYDGAIGECVKDYGITKKWLNKVFGQFRLTNTTKAWKRALLMLSPDSEYPLDPVEARNINLSVEQLRDAWTDPTLMYMAVGQSTEDYDEVFATKGYQKKALREIANYRSVTEKILLK